MNGYTATIGKQIRAKIKGLCGSKNSKANDAESSKLKQNKADFVLITPLASGRFFVRSTCASNFLSAKSFIMQPAERIKNAPINSKKSKYNSLKILPLASDKAQAAGQKVRNVPIGLLARKS